MPVCLSCWGDRDLQRKKPRESKRATVVMSSGSACPFKTVKIVAPRFKPSVAKSWHGTVAHQFGKGALRSLLQTLATRILESSNLSDATGKTKGAWGR